MENPGSGSFHPWHHDQSGHASTANSLEWLRRGLIAPPGRPFCSPGQFMTAVLVCPVLAPTSRLIATAFCRTPSTHSLPTPLATSALLLSSPDPWNRRVCTVGHLPLRKECAPSLALSSRPFGAISLSHLARWKCGGSLFQSSAQNHPNLALTPCWVFLFLY